MESRPAAPRGLGRMAEHTSGPLDWFSQGPISSFHFFPINPSSPASPFLLSRLSSAHPCYCMHRKPSLQLAFKSAHPHQLCLQPHSALGATGPQLPGTQGCPAIDPCHLFEHRLPDPNCPSLHGSCSFFPEL